ncbi:uncharacterized protein At1g51745-like [Magnolia sinica]|uniref:uncharacterized protein At1g51745-like n=1 Tax=Magnolia sinica TaxID=86752 RepID=UPI002659F82D|nr:uncharacterized protein At1g51745-like [Magnolia sinica]
MAMGSSCKPNCRGIDASVGGLVWVRRRNGSWWPGRILGADELPETWLLSPRSGTPVKLLGREDASMDWYNLETSKRVKAFRCGEYDECIEKAKAYATHANRKGVKYARREEAILQALELECARFGHQEYHSKVGNSTGTLYDSLIRQSHKMSGPSKEHDSVAGILSYPKGDSTQESSQSVILFEQPNHASMSEVHLMQNKRRKTPNDSEDDGTEGTKRMKGLQDLGLRVASKRKPNMHFPCEGSLELVLPDCASLTESNICSSLSTHSPVNSSKGSCSTLKRRCSQVSYVPENFKRKDRRRPLTKVMESTAKVAIPGFFDGGACPGQSSLEGIVEVKVESTLSKKNFSMVINNHSDSMGTSCEKETSFDASEHTCNASADANNSISHQEEKDNTFSSVLESHDDDCSDAFLNVPFVREENGTGGFSTALKPCASRKIESDTAGKQSSHCNQVGLIPLNNEELDETGSTSFASHLSHAERRMEKQTSKWQVKGKWHPKSASKNSCKSPDSRSSNQSEHMDGSFVDFGSKVNSSSFESLTSDNCNQLGKCGLVSEDPGDGLLHGNRLVSNTQAQIVGPSELALDNSRRRDLGSREVMQSVEVKKIACKSLPYDKPAVGKLTNHARNMEPSFTRGMPVCPMLPQRSPRQSRLTACSSGRVCDAPNVRSLGGSQLYDVNLDVQTSYHGHRVPLVSLMSRWNGQAIVGHPTTVEVLEDGHCDLLMSGIDSGRASSNHDLYDVLIENLPEKPKDIVNGLLLMDGSSKMTGALQNQIGYADLPIPEARRSTRHHSTGRSPSSRKKPPKKIRKCGFLSKKTRKLSSITVDRELKREERKPVVEKGGPVIACVPLKLVFSRINEGLSGSVRPAHRILTSKDM